MTTLIGKLVNYTDGIGEVIADDGYRVQVRVPDEEYPREILTRVAAERVITPRAEIPYPQGYRAPSLELAGALVIEAEYAREARARDEFFGIVAPA